MKLYPHPRLFLSKESEKQPVLFVLFFHVYQSVFTVCMQYTVKLCMYMFCDLSSC